MTSIPFISIDPVTAKDHDDAICAIKDLDNPGSYIIWVAIADVAKYVTPGDELDLEALRRGNTTYFPDLVVPMIPDILSGDSCSLKEGKIRAVLAVKICINQKGEKTNHHFFRGIIKNEIATSYEEAQSALENSNFAKTRTRLGDLLEPLQAAFKLLQKQKQTREPLELVLTEREILFDSDNNVKSIRRKPILESHRIVEEIMILANVCAAETIQKNGYPLLSRTHEPPTFEKLMTLKNVARSLDISLNISAGVSGAALNNFLAKARQKNCEDLISMLILQSMSQAHYSPNQSGHFGLNLPTYTHFTSPIRRYSDLLIHRALISIHKWGTLEYSTNKSELAKIGAHLSKTERRSMSAERETKDRYLAEFLKDKIGGEFSGRINGLSKSGIFVQLNETGADGLIPLSFLRGDRFYLNKGKNELIGRTSKRKLKIGANVLVSVQDANEISGSLIFNLVEYENKSVIQLHQSNVKHKFRRKGRKRSKF